jgi:hypothetical protein
MPLISGSQETLGIVVYAGNHLVETGSAVGRAAWYDDFLGTMIGCVDVRSMAVE